MGSLKQPARNNESTRRLDQGSIQSLRFKSSKRNYETELAIRGFIVNGVPMLLFLGGIIFLVEYATDVKFARQVTKTVNAYVSPYLGGKKLPMPPVPKSQGKHEYVASDPKETSDDEAKSQDSSKTSVSPDQKQNKPKRKRFRWWRRRATPPQASAGKAQ